VRAGDKDTIALLTTLKAKLAAKDSTIFVDSCFGGINGVAKQVSTSIPDAWVFGGVVSLTSSITVAPNEADEKGGPPRIVNEASFDEVLSPTDKSKALGHVFDERLLAFKAGENKGSVMQWTDLSKNKKIFRVGSKVTTTEEIPAYRFVGKSVVKKSLEELQENGINNGFEATLPKGLQGTILFIDDVGETPATGNLFINLDLLEAWHKDKEEWTETGGAGKMLGPYYVSVFDRGTLEI